MEQKQTARKATQDPFHSGRWLTNPPDDWSYPTREAAEAACADPNWAEVYAARDLATGLIWMRGRWCIQRKAGAPETTLPTQIETLVATARNTGLSDETIVAALLEAAETLRDGVS